MSTYTVRYRKNGAFFWSTVRRVKGDLNTVREGLQCRVLILHDETRLEIPALSHEFRFSKERHLIILKKMEAEAGQKLSVIEGG